MIKIAHKSETRAILNIPEEVASTVVEITTILDENYGEERNVEQDLGGYVLIVETVKDIKTIRKQIGMENTLPEYVELIKCSNGDKYTNSLILLSSDYSISLLIPLELTPKELLKYLEE